MSESEIQLTAVERQTLQFIREQMRGQFGVSDIEANVGRMPFGPELSTIRRTLRQGVRLGVLEEVGKDGYRKLYQVVRQPCEDEPKVEAAVAETDKLLEQLVEIVVRLERLEEKLQSLEQQVRPQEAMQEGPTFLVNFDGGSFWVAAAEVVPDRYYGWAGVEICKMRVRDVKGVMDGKDIEVPARRTGEGFVKVKVRVVWQGPDYADPDGTYVVAQIVK